MRLALRSQRASPDRERRRTIVVWGSSESGTSGLVGALRSESTKSVGDRWAIDLVDASPDIVAYGDSASLALRLRGVKDTPIRRPERAFTAPVRRYEGRRVLHSADLTFLDPRGRLAAEPTSPEARRTLAAATTADAILWLLEISVPGVSPAADRLQLLRQLIALLDAASATEMTVPVVVALTKIDRLAAAEMRRTLEAPEEALRTILGDASFGWLLAAFPRLHCSAFSAAGTVRNAVRPVGLTSIFDWFVEEWRREEQVADAARRSARRSAKVAQVRRRAPVAAMIAAVAALVAFAGVAAARLLSQRTQTWASAAGSVLTTADRGAGSTTDSLSSTSITAPATVTPPFIAFAAAAIKRGDATGALRTLDALHVADSSTERPVVDSLIALAAMQGTEQALGSPTAEGQALELIVNSTSAAIARARPGTSVIAPLSLARAGACIGGRMNCSADQVREDLAWAILLGTPAEQDQARRLRSVLVGDSVVGR